MQKGPRSSGIPSQTRDFIIKPIKAIMTLLQKIVYYIANEYFHCCAVKIIIFLKL